jgi:hypothetical protein
VVAIAAGIGAGEIEPGPFRAFWSVVATLAAIVLAGAAHALR